ncbi:MAG: carboxyl transferase domain-containing protein [Phycisphaerae bacterium]
MAFVLPFEHEIVALDAQLSDMSDHDPDYAATVTRLEALEREVYPNLGAHDLFLLSGSPLRPKTLDYVGHIFHDVTLSYDPDVKGDYLVIGGEGKIEIEGKDVDVIIVGQQTGPSSQLEVLRKQPVTEYRRWNQGMGYPDGYRKAVYFMNLAEKRGWPVVVFVDTPGADPSEFAEEEGQAFAINDVIHRTTSLRTPSLAYIISQGASGGAIAITATNRTIINQYATHMVISPGGCASILFRNRSPESIRRAAEGLCLTSADAIQQGTSDEIVEEGTHPGHRYPHELLAAGKEAVKRNLGMLLSLRGEEAERVRREKFFAMGRWGSSESTRAADALAKQAIEQSRAFEKVQKRVAGFIAEANSKSHSIGDAPPDEAALLIGREARWEIGRVIYALEHVDQEYLSKVFGHDARALTDAQWAQVHEFALERRYDHENGDTSLHPNDGETPYRRLHPADWIRLITDEDTFREFEETMHYCSVDQLGFPDYEEALARGIEATGLESGLVTGTAKIGEHDAVVAINNFGLVGSSLCDEIGEKFVYAAHHALKAKVPLISVSKGGGARMQEGTPSMHRNIPKAQHALNELEEAGVPHISVICDPTLGGTAISYGLRGDLMIVVKGSANIGFSGKRVVEQFQQRKVAAGFQSGAWLLHRGFVDGCVDTYDMRDRLIELLKHVADGKNLRDLRARRERKWKPAKQVKLGPSPIESAPSDRTSQTEPEEVLSA